MLFTVMPNEATSVASVRAIPVTAARRLLDSIRLSTGCFTLMDVMLRMRPQPCAFMPGSTARVSSTTLVSNRRVAASHVSGERLSNVPAGGPPALVTSTSTRPKRASATATTAAPAPGAAKSAGTASTGTPLAASMAAAVVRRSASPRAQSTRCAPSAASSSATARPRPLLAAATSAILPCSPKSMRRVF